MRNAVRNLPRERRVAAAYARAAEICDEDVATNRRIGEHGLQAHPGRGGAQGGQASRSTCSPTATPAGSPPSTGARRTAPIYAAHDRGIPVHVWVDETRPRNQGAALTAFELGAHGVPHTIIVDNAGGHLMQHGLVDLCIVGTDRVTANGDVANKIGTYLKALAAKDNGVPFYVALPHSTIDWTLDVRRRHPHRGARRRRGAGHERPHRGRQGRARRDRRPRQPRPQRCLRRDAGAARSPASITERGVCAASREGLASLYRRELSGLHTRPPSQARSDGKNRGSVQLRTFRAFACMVFHRDITPPSASNAFAS